METVNKNTTEYKAESWRQHERFKRTVGGTILLLVGGVLMAREAGVEFPEWFFTWQMIVILWGVYMGAKTRFTEWGWLIPVAVGVVFLSDRFIEGFTIHAYMWPIIIIAIGLTMIARPRPRRCRQ